MPHLTNRNVISIVQLAVYAPLLLVSLTLLRRHGVIRNVGWIFIALFVLLRLVGSGLDVATIANRRSPSLYIGSATCSGIGLSPLLLATSGIVEQLTRDLDEKLERHFLGLTIRIQTRLIEIVAAVAMILIIVGSVRAGNEFKDTRTFTPQGLIQAGTALFIVVYIAVVDSVVFATIHAHRDMLELRRPALLRAAWIGLLLILVRLVYSCLSSFDTSSSTFNILSGNVWLWFGMAVVEEILVVLLYEIAGLVTPATR